METEENQQEVQNNEFEYCLVSRQELEKLLYFCPHCGARPRKRGRQPKEPPPLQSMNAREQRNITWKVKGTNVSAYWKCCDKSNNQKNWFAQTKIGEMYSGNLAVCAGMTVAPIDHSSMKHFAKAINMPMISESTFHAHKMLFVNPAISELYFGKQQEVLRQVQGVPPHEIDVAIDAQYDSPGFCAELASETMMDIKSNRIVTFAVTQKSETENISNRMELRGAEKVIQEMQTKGVRLASVTTDKHLKVVKHLREVLKIPTRFDLWHLLHRMNSKIRSASKNRLDAEDKRTMRSLKKRFFTHVWKSVEVANGDSREFIERVFSFFLHVIGKHEWKKYAYFYLQFKVENGTATGKEFNGFYFKKVFGCSHQELDGNAQENVDNNDKALQLLYEIATSTSFYNDFGKVKSQSSTSAVESFHSLKLRYAPKRKYFGKQAMESKMMLAVMHWNTTQESERNIVNVYESFSKARGEDRKITRYKPVDQPWKRTIVKRAMELKSESRSKPRIQLVREGEDDEEFGREPDITDSEESDVEEDNSE